MADLRTMTEAQYEALLAERDKALDNYAAAGRLADQYLTEITALRADRDRLTAVVAAVRAVPTWDPLQPDGHVMVRYDDLTDALRGAPRQTWENAGDVTRPAEQLRQVRQALDIRNNELADALAEQRRLAGQVQRVRAWYDEEATKPLSEDTRRTAYAALCALDGPAS